MDFHKLTKALSAKQSGDEWMACCPAHEDRTPSLAIREKEGKTLLHCHAGCFYEDVVKALEEKGIFSGQNKNNKKSSTHHPKTIPFKDVSRCKEALTEENRKYLKDRGISDIVIELNNLGQKDDRIAIPILGVDKDNQRHVYDIRLHKPIPLRQEGEVKTLAWEKGYGTARLYVPQFQEGQSKVYGNDHLVLCEGEIDALVLASNEIVSATNTNGAGIWNDGFSKELPQSLKSIVIAMDNDDAGKNGAIKRANSLQREGFNIKILQWPVDRKEGHDVSDEIKIYGIESLKKLLEEAKLYTFPDLISLDTIQPKEVEWLWTGFIPLGKITVLQGDPGVGKTFIACYIAGRISRGEPLYGDVGSTFPANVLYIAAEDDLADTMVPRFNSTNADLKRISTTTLHIDLANRDSLEILEQRIKQTQAKIVFFDTVDNHIGVEINPNGNNQVRSITRPLRDLAVKYNCAILLIRHMRKDPTGGALHRGSGSVAWTGAARSVLYVAKDPKDGEQRLLFQLKGNLAKDPSSLGYKIQDNKVEWTGTTNLRPEDVGAEKSDRCSPIDEAEEFLRNYLQNGERPQEEIVDAAENEGIREKTLNRAKKPAGVKSQKKGDKWYWSLHSAQEGQLIPPGLATLKKNPSSSDNDSILLSDIAVNDHLERSPVESPFFENQIESNSQYSDEEIPF